MVPFSGLMPWKAGALFALLALKANPSTASARVELSPYGLEPLWARDLVDVDVSARYPRDFLPSGTEDLRKRSKIHARAPFPAPGKPNEKPNGQQTGKPAEKPAEKPKVEMPKDKDKINPQQAASLVQPGPKDKSGYYTHVQGDDAKKMGRDDMKNKVKEQGHFGLDEALNHPERGRLNDPKNPNTFRRTDSDKSKKQKQQEDKDHWKAVSSQHAKLAEGKTHLHTNGPRDPHPQSVWEQHEKPQITRPGGSATSIERIDHSTGNKKTEWERQDSKNLVKQDPKKLEKQVSKKLEKQDSKNLQRQDSKKGLGTSGSAGGTSGSSSPDLKRQGSSKNQAGQKNQLRKQQSQEIPEPKPFEKPEINKPNVQMPKIDAKKQFQQMQQQKQNMMPQKMNIQKPVIAKPAIGNPMGMQTPQKPTFSKIGKLF